MPVRRNFEMKKVMTLLLLLTISLSVISCDRSSSTSDSSSESMETSSVDGQEMESSDTAEDPGTEDNTYVEISWDDLCESVYSINITLDNYEEYITYGYVEASGNGNFPIDECWCYILQNSDKYKNVNIKIEGQFSFVQTETAYVQGTDELMYEDQEIYSETADYSKEFEKADAEDYIAYLSTKESEKQEERSTAPTYESRMADVITKNEITDISCSAVSGYLFVMDIDEAYWNNINEFHGLGKSSAFLYSQTPDGYYIFLYDTGNYDVILGEETRSHIGDDWWNYVSPTSKIIDKGDLATE